jgi:tryptophan synthase alpha chain
MTGLSISEVFSDRRARGQAALVPYLTAGYPAAGSTPDALHALAEAGGDVIELGIPFSDPLADGPTIQRSSHVSLGHGTTVSSVLEDLRTFRSGSDRPVVLFTYLNPVLRYGVEAFLDDAVEAGAQGLLLTDLPAGADPELEARVRASGLDLIRLVAPTTSAERIRSIASGASGFLYYISRTGVTGARERLREGLAEEVRRLRGVVSIPVAVGFGISTPEQAATVAAAADGVVVGSALIQTLDQGGIEGARAFIASLRRGMDGAAAG